MSMRTRKKQLENGMTEDDIGGLAMRLWERIMYPTAQLEEAPLPDSGFLAVAGTIINIEFSSDITVKKTTVKELAETLRKAYCEANNLPATEPNEVEQKAWTARVRKPVRSMTGC